jgi:DNA-binding transcriptional MocR family regulator
MTNYDRFLSRCGGVMRESAIRQMGAVLAAGRDMVSFAPGYPAEDAFPWQAFSEIARDVLTGDDGSVLQYGPTRGLKPLREVIVGVMAGRAVATDIARIVVTTGSQQALDLAARVLLDPGDVVLLELPSYTGAITAFRNVGASLIGVEQERDGIDFDALNRTLTDLRRAGRRVKLLYVVPNFQNPTGLLLSAAKRQRLLEWADAHDVLILEDDPYRDLYFPDVTTADETRPIAADDPLNGRVIYLSSFSKTLAPGLRVAWMSAPAALAAKFELAKQAADLCTGGLDQWIVYEACRRGVLERQLPMLRAHYQRKRDVMVAALTTSLGGELSWPEPRGGFFLWAKLAPPVTSDALLPLAQGHGVVYVAGSAFFVNGAGQEYMRLSFSAPAPDRIELGVSRLAAAIQEARAVASTSSVG